MKFNWKGFTEEDFVNYCATIENNQMFDNDFVGRVTVGGLCFDFIVREDNDELVLDYDLYIGGIDDGYGYGKDNYPYTEGGGGRFENSLIFMSYNDFVKQAEESLTDYIYNSNYSTKYNLIEKIKTGEDNNNESKILSLGKYFVKEISTLDGYKLDNNYYEVNLNYKDQNEEVVLGNIKIINEKIRCDLVYITSDSDGKFIENVEINVADNDGNIVFKGKTDTQGRVLINNLPYGEYYIKQIKVPSGYILNDQEYRFYVNDSTCNSNINVTNERTIMPITSKQNSMYLVSYILILGIGVYNFVKKDS